MKPVVVVALVALAGCSSVRGGPERSLDPNRDVLRMAVAESLHEELVRRALQPGASVAERNAIVFARLAELDRLYLDYERALTNDLRRSGFALTLVQVALGGVGAFVPETTSQILSGVSGGLAGAREAFNKEILVDRTVGALTAQMRAARNATKAAIYERLQANTATYPLTAALSDLAVYRQAGTLTAALVGISESATLQEIQADRTLQAQQRAFRVERSSAQVSEPAQDRIARIVGAIENPARVSDERVLELANNPPTTDPTFTFVLGDEPFTSAAVARDALRLAIRTLDRTDDALIRPWESALGLN